LACVFTIGNQADVDVARMLEARVRTEPVGLPVLLNGHVGDELFRLKNCPLEMSRIRSRIPAPEGSESLFETFFTEESPRPYRVGTV
jgi:hypothetical protein